MNCAPGSPSPLPTFCSLLLGQLLVPMPKPLPMAAAGVYQAGETQAQDVALLRRHKVTHVLSIGARGPTDADDIDNLRIGLPHSDDADLLGHLPQCLEYRHKAVHRGGVVLVHCKAGICRSAAVAAAYLMTVDPTLDPISAVQLLRRNTGRPCVNPSAEFMDQLAVFHEQMQKAAQQPSQ